MTGEIGPFDTIVIPLLKKLTAACCDLEDLAQIDPDHPSSRIAVVILVIDRRSTAAIGNFLTRIEQIIELKGKPHALEKRHFLD